MSIPTSDYDTQSYTNNTGATIEGFTFLLDLSLQSSEFKANWNSSDGGRGRACKSDGTTELQCAFVSPDHTAKTGAALVYWGDLANGATATIRLFPPNTANSEYAPSDTYGSQNAIASSFGAFYPDGGITDITANANTGTAQGGMTPGGVSGPVGKATDHDGVDDYTSVPDDDSLSLDETNGTSWFFAYYMPAGGLDSTRAVFAKYFDNEPFNGEWYIAITANNEIGGADGGVLLQLLDASATTRKRAETNVALTEDAWNTVGFSWDGTKGAVGGVTAVINGAQVSLTEAEAGFDAIYNRTAIVTIGAGLTGSPYDSYTDGPLCFVFFRQAETSAEWFEVMDAQIRDNAAFWGTRTWSGGGGVTHEISVSDGIVFSDAVAKTTRFNLSVTDGVLASDYFSRGVRFRIDVQDGIKISDGFDRSASMLISVNDQVQFSDLPGVNCKFNIDVEDGVILSDHLTFGGSILISVTDGVVFSDSVSAVRKIWQTVTDNIIFSDSVLGTAKYRLTIRDGVLFSDIISTAIKYLISVHDGIKLSDIVVDTTFLPKGELRIEIISKKARIVFTSGKKPRIDFL